MSTTTAFTVVEPTSTPTMYTTLDGSEALCTRLASICSFFLRRFTSPIKSSSFTSILMVGLWLLLLQQPFPFSSCVTKPPLAIAYSSVPLLDSSAQSLKPVNRLLQQPLDYARIVVCESNNVVERRKAVWLADLLHLFQLPIFEFVIFNRAPVV